MRPLVRFFLLVPATLAMVCALATGPAAAQSIPTVFSSPSSGPALPPGVRIDGLYRTAPISIDGVFLFRIATPANASADQMSVETRQEFINAAIAQILEQDPSKNNETYYDPKTLSVSATQDGSQAVISAKDATHGNFPLMTVTSADAKYQSLPVMTLAKEWSATLQTALITALQKRQPAVVRRNVVTIWIVGGVLVLATVLAWAIVAAIRRRTRSLHQLVDQRTRELESAQSDAKPEDGDSARRQLRFFGLAIRLADPQLSLTVYNAFEALIVWLMVLAWFGATVWVLSLFPETTPLSQILRHRASAIVVVVVVAILLVKACEIAVARIARAAAERAELGLRSDKTRQLLRIPTIARATTASVTFVIGFVCVLGVINQLGFSTGSVLTLGGIAALGISLAAQNLVRDFLGGFLVLVEDQYVVGDYVTIGETSGIVERMTLRVAQIRDASGNLVTIPYGGVTQVINGSRDWSRVDFRFVIDPVSEVGPSLELFRSTLASIGAMKEWNGVILDAEEWSGVEYVSATGIILRASVKTAPLRQFEVKRELYAVMADAFEKAGIPLGIDPKFGGAPIASAPPNISKPPVK